MANRASHQDFSAQPDLRSLLFEAGGKLEADSLFRSPYYPDSFIFPYNPDPLVRGNNYSVYDEMRDDDQIKVCLTLKKDMILNSGWIISCENQEIAHFVESNLHNVGELDPLEPDFDQSLRDILNAYDFGFALSETIFTPPKSTKSGKWELRSLKVRPPHSFIFHIDDGGKVIQIEQFGAKGTLKLDPNIFLHYSYQSDFGNPYGKSDLRAAHPAWKAKKFVFRMAMRYAERFAGATAIGRYNPAMSTGEINALHSALRSLQDNTTLTIPEEARIEFLQAGRDSSDSYNKLLHMLNMWIARALLIPDLLGISGDQTSSGSLALGKEQFKVFLSSIANDRMMLGKRITSKIIRPLVQINFGDIPCEFKFKPLEVGDEKEFLRLWVDAINGGIFRPSDEEINHFRRKTGFPEGEIEEREENGEGQDEKEQSQEQSQAEIGQKEDEPKDKIEESRNVLKFRKATPYELKVDFAAIQKTLLASDDSLSIEIGSILKRIAKDLLDQAKERNVLGRFAPEALEKIEPKYRRELNSAIKGHFVSLFKLGIQNAKKEILPTENSKSKFVADAILPEDFEELIRAESFKLAGELSNEVRKRFSNEVFEALKNGVPVTELSKRISANIEGYNSAQVKSILRTKTTEVFNAARKTFFESDDIASGLIVGYQYSAVIDDVTTEVCRRLDERIFDKDTMPPELVPPLHFNCRSLLVPITKFEPHKFSEVPKFETLRNWGGNLVPKETGEKSRFSSHAETPHDEPVPTKIFTTEGTLNIAGDHFVIAPPVSGRLKILFIRAANMDKDYPVDIGFREHIQAPLSMQQTLFASGGLFERSLIDNPWLLSPSNGLMIHLSANIAVSYSCEYEILENLIDNDVQ